MRAKALLAVLLVLALADWAALNFAVGPAVLQSSPSDAPAALAVDEPPRPTAPLPPLPPKRAPSVETHLSTAAAMPSAPSTPPPSAAPIAQPERTVPPVAPIHFAKQSALVGEDAQASLAKVARTLRDDPSLRLRVEGHADERGPAHLNTWLGSQRAEVVKAHLIALGIEPERMTTVSFGADRPVDTAGTEEAYARNRRVEIVWEGGER